MGREDGKIIPLYDADVLKDEICVCRRSLPKLLRQQSENTSMTSEIDASGCTIHFCTLFCREAESCSMSYFTPILNIIGFPKF